MGAISQANARPRAPRVRRASRDRPETPQSAARLPSNRGAMNARWRARVSTSYRADGCSSASRQSRMMFNTVTVPALRPVRRTDAPERPLIVAPTCQSEIKRTLRRRSRRRKTAPSAGVLRARSPHSIRMVNARFPGRPVWFRNGGRAQCGSSRRRPPSIENLRRIESFGLLAIFGELSSMQTLAIYRPSARQRPKARNQRGRTKKRRPGSRNVFSASHGVLARAGARAVAEGQDA